MTYQLAEVAPYPLWDQFSAAWEAGGLAFVLFLALMLVFTGRVFTARERDRLEKQLAKLDEDWKTRYEQNDRRWEQQLAEVRARSETQERLLYQMMGMSRDVTNVAKQAANAAQQATIAGNGHTS